MLNRGYRCCTAGTCVVLCLVCVVPDAVAQSSAARAKLHDSQGPTPATGLSPTPARDENTTPSSGYNSYFWWGVGAEVGLGAGSSVGDGSSEFTAFSTTPLRLHFWWVPFSWAALRPAVAYSFLHVEEAVHSFEPSLAIRFGRLRATDSIWSITVSLAHLTGPTDTYDSSGTRYTTTITGKRLGLSLDARVMAAERYRHIVSLKAEVGGLSSEDMRSKNQSDEWRGWFLVTLSLELNWRIPK